MLDAYTSIFVPNAGVEQFIYCDAIVEKRFHCMLRLIKNRIYFVPADIDIYYDIRCLSL